MTKKNSERGRIPTIICIVVTIVAAIGLFLGYFTGEILWAIALLIPTVAYQAYRTEGVSTRWASWVLLLLLIATMILFIFNVNYDLRQLLGEEETSVMGYVIPVGDIKMIMPAAMAICAVILLLRTRGRYTRWLGAVIFISSVAIVYQVDPEAIGELLRIAIRYFIW